MGWRFRHSIKILPGIRLNFGKSGFTSTTIGGKFFKTNVSDKGVRHTLSAPGTGISYTTQPQKLSTNNFPSSAKAPVWTIILVGMLGSGLVWAFIALSLDISNSGSRAFTPSPAPLKAYDPSQVAISPVTEDQPKLLGKSAYVIANSANVRETPTGNGAVTKKLLFGTGLQVVKEQGAWLFVSHDGQTGWTNRSAVRYLEDGTRTIPFKATATKDNSPSLYSDTSSSSPYSPSSDSRTVQVRGYTRKDGTYVSPHSRRSPRR